MIIFHVPKERGNREERKEREEREERKVGPLADPPAFVFCLHFLIPASAGVQASPIPGRDTLPHRNTHQLCLVSNSEQSYFVEPIPYSNLDFARFFPPTLAQSFGLLRTRLSTVPQTCESLSLTLPDFPVSSILQGRQKILL